MDILSYWHALSDRWTKLRVGPGVRAEIYSAMSDHLTQGKPLKRTLEGLHSIYSDDGKRPRAPIAQMLAEVRAKVTGGNTLDVALENWIGPEERALLAAGATAGKLPETLQRAADIASLKSRLTGKAVMTLPYPVVLLAMVSYTLSIVANRVVPPLERSAPHETWEGTGALLYYISYFVTHFGWATIAAFVAMAAFAIWSLPRALAGDLRYHLDFLPPWSFYKRMQGAMFFTAFATLLQAGVKMNDALAVIASNATPYVRQRVQAVGMALVGGSGFGSALANTGYLFPTKRAIQTARMYDESENFASAIATMAAAQVKAIEVALMALIGTMLVAVILLNVIIAALVAVGTQSIISAIPGV